MTAPLSQDLRERIVRAVEGGSTIRQAARRFAVSASAAIKLMQRVRQTGSSAPAKIGGSRRPLLEKHADELRAIVSSQAGITLREIKAALAVRGIVVKALSTIADMLHRLGLSHKKRACERPSRIGPTWPRTRAAGGGGGAPRGGGGGGRRSVEGGRFVSREEPAATTAMTRLYGWGPRGERLVDAAPAGHWKTTTVVAGLRASGIMAPFVLDGPMTGDAFRLYVEQRLAPALEPGDAVVMDNLSVHKVAGVPEAIRAAGSPALLVER